MASSRSPPRRESRDVARHRSACVFPLNSPPPASMQPCTRRSALRPRPRVRRDLVRRGPAACSVPRTRIRLARDLRDAGTRLLVQPLLAVQAVGPTTLTGCPCCARQWPPVRWAGRRHSRWRGWQRRRHRQRGWRRPQRRAGANWRARWPVRCGRKCGSTRDRQRNGSAMNRQLALDCRDLTTCAGASSRDRCNAVRDHPSR